MFQDFDSYTPAMVRNPFTIGEFYFNTNITMEEIKDDSGSGRIFQETFENTISTSTSSQEESFSQSPYKVRKLNNQRRVKTKIDESASPQPILSKSSRETGHSSDRLSNCMDSLGMAPETATKNPVQNPRKNLPGLVLQRVKTSCERYLKPSTKEFDESMMYIKKVLDQEKGLNRDDLRRYLAKRLTSAKTWKQVQEYTEEGKFLGRVVLQIAVEFFLEDGSRDFKLWLEESKMKETTKLEIEKSKEWLYGKFQSLLNENCYKLSKDARTQKRDDDETITERIFD